MHVLIVYVHPEPTSFNSAMKDLAADRLRVLGHTVEVSDLYADKFDPVERAAHYRERVDADRFAPLAEQRHASCTSSLPADVRREIDRIKRAELVIFQFPLWWHAQPAVLKGWFDRVFVSGLLYSSTMRYDRGVFRGKLAVASITTGAPEVAFEPGGRGGDIELLLWPIHYSLHYMGFSVLKPFLAFGVAGHGYEYQDGDGQAVHLKGYIHAWLERLAHLQNEPRLRFPSWNDWDDMGRKMNSIVGEGAGLRFRP